MSKKILIVDDSALMRRVVSDIIRTRKEYEIFDIAKDGEAALKVIMANADEIDVVVMDINMPKMSGIEVLEQLQHFHIKHKTIVVSSVAKEGAAETIRALELGAFDFVTKPEGYGELTSEDFKNALLNSLDAAADAKKIGTDSVAKKGASTKSTEAVVPAKTATTVTPKRSSGSDKLVAVACSTGGPKSLQNVIPLLPKNLAAPVVLVQHMPKGFTASLALRLNELSQIKVTEAADNEILENGHVYIAPGGRHMEVVEDGKGVYRIKLNDMPPVDALRPCANVMYDSLTKISCNDITCVVLTGMGADGTKGISNLSRNKKLHVIAQDQATCVVYGMPKAVAQAGLVDEVVPLDEVANSIIRNVGVS